MSADRTHALVTLALVDPTDTLATLRDAEAMMLGGGVNKPRLASLIEQIEAQTKPPKPAEPTGLGAVVEDSEGFRWVRNDAPIEPSWRCDHRGWQTWAKVDAVRVLSEGVTA